MKTSMNQGAIARDRSQSTETVTVDHGGHLFHTMTTDLRGEHPEESYRSVLESARKKKGGHVLAQFVLGGCRNRGLEAPGNRSCGRDEYRGTQVWRTPMVV